MKQIISLGGPTGVGKDTLKSLLLKYQELIFIPRTTTRQPRPTEKVGEDYIFVSPEVFLEMERNGAFCGIDRFNGQNYGVEMRRIFSAFERQRSIVGIFGRCSFGVRERFPKNTLLIYIMPPGATLDEKLEELRRRLIHRGDPKDDIQKRLVCARQQLVEEPPLFDQTVENGGLEKAVAEILGHIHR